MPRLAYLAVVVALAAFAGGCTLHFSDDTGDDTCDTAAEPAPDQLRNPETLICESFGYGGCTPGCPCALEAVPIPTWGTCGNPCEVLDETTCLAATECRAAYDRNCYTNDGPCTLEVPFLGCFPVDQQGPITGGTCEGLDSWSCSMHNDCIALHSEQCSGAQCWQQFVECQSEPTPEPCDGAPACG